MAEPRAGLVDLRLKWIRYLKNHLSSQTLRGSYSSIEKTKKQSYLCFILSKGYTALVYLTVKYKIVMLSVQ